MVKLHSLGLTTDLMFIDYNGSISSRANYYVVRTVSNPSFWYGNLLIFDAPPAPGDFERWIALFKKEIAEKQKTQHMVFLWDTVNGEKGTTDQFLKYGFELDQTVVLTTNQVILPGKYNADIKVRVLESDEDWDQALINQIKCRDESNGETSEDHTKFKGTQMANYRAMQIDGLGNWYGAFLDKVLIGDLGLFFQEKTGRFQNVGTHPDYRRKGVCATLVYEVSKMALLNHNLEHLVMVADENYHAAGIYESVGFKATEHLVGLCNNQYHY